MARTAKTIAGMILTIIFIIATAAIIGAAGFVLVIAGIYYSFVLFLNHGVLASALMIGFMAALLFVATRLLIKQILKGTN